MLALTVLLLAFVTGCLPSAEARPTVIGNELVTDGGISFFRSPNASILPPAGADQPLRFETNTTDVFAGTGTAINNGVNLTGNAQYVVQVSSAGVPHMQVNAQARTDVLQSLTPNGQLTITARGGIGAGSAVLNMGESSTARWSFNSGGRMGNATFYGSALATCGASIEGRTWQRDPLSGAATGSRTRMCQCTSDGSSVYAWQNVVTGNVGTTTTCPN